MSTNKVVLFGEKAAGVYRMSDIYIPDSENYVSVEDSGKIVPAVGSLVIDDTRGLHNQQYTVTAIDPETYNPTLVPSAFVYDTSAQPDRVLSYGNELLMLYFMPTTITRDGQEVPITRLVVDNKLSFFGNHAATYQLCRYTEQGQLETISRWYRPNGIEAGTAIPMLETGVEGVRKCDGCYTNVTLKEGDSIICKVYSAGGILLSMVTLIAKQGHLLNEIASVANPIVDMLIEANQIDQDGTLYLYENQDPNELAIFPILVYQDDSRKEVAIDNFKGFVYGLPEVKTDIVGMEYRILIKYYLGDDDVVMDYENKFAYYRTTDVTWQANKTYYLRTAGNDCWNYTEISSADYNVGDPIPTTEADYFERHEVGVQLNPGSNAVRFISREATIRIVEVEAMRASKVSIIPMWNAGSNRWEFEYLKYLETMDVSPLPLRVSVSAENTYLVENPVINGGEFGTTQHTSITYTNKIANKYNRATQDIFIALNDKRIANNNVNYLISDALDSDRQYGRNDDNHIRPFIRKSGTTYIIPESAFAANSTQTAEQVFLDNFYYQANPPADPNTGAVIKPTHFIIKDLEGQQLVNPIALADRHNPLGITTTNSTVIVEFIERIEYLTDQGQQTHTDRYLYGVPVEIITN